MKPEIKEKWVAALRSGEYTQATGYLRTKEGFCCLGVLCDIVQEDVGMHWIKGTEYGLECYRYTKNNNYIHHSLTLSASGCLPTEVVNLSDLEDYDPVIWYGDDGSTLAELNDKGLTFNEIADIIEAQL